LGEKIAWSKKIISFRPNHKIFSGLVARAGLKKKRKTFRNSKKRSNLTKNIGTVAIS
jgi:hypothetical protein